MIDHFVHFVDEAAARANPVMGAYWVEGDDLGPGAWRGDVVIPALSVYQVTGTETVTDPETGVSYQRELREYYAGWFATVALADLDDGLRSLSWIVADRTAAEAGESNFVLYLSPELSGTDLDSVKVSPLFAGANYPFHRAAPYWR